jgi:hypothetical protein
MTFNSSLVNFLTVGDFASDSTYAMPLSQQLVTLPIYGLNFANAGGGSTYTLETTGNMLALMNLQTTTSYGVVISVPQASGGLVTRQLTGSSSISITNGTGASGNPTLSVQPGSTVQLINVKVNGTTIGSARSTLNFIPGSNVGINATDSGGITNITLTSTAATSIASAPFVTFTANSSVTGAQNIGLLTSGLLKNTVSAASSTLSTAVAGTDYLLPNAALTSFASITPANGDLLYYTGSAWTALAPGATGTVLTVTGSTALGWIANASGDVTLAGAQTFTGIKTFTPKTIFTNSIQIPLGAAVGKVLGSDVSGNATWTVAGAGDVTLAGANTYTGTNLFNTNLPTSTVTPTTGTQLITKTYADATYTAVPTVALVTTSDTTVTTIASVSVSALSTVLVTGTLVGSSADHTNACGGTFSVTATRASGGNITLVSPASVILGSTTSALFNTVVSTGTQSILIQVTGIAATTYNWSVKYKTHSI